MILNNQSMAIEMAQRMLFAALENPNPTSDELLKLAKGVVQAVSALFPNEEIDLQDFVREIEGKLNIFQPTTSIMFDNSDHVPWLGTQQDQISWKFWERYLQHLRLNEKLPPIVLQRLDESTRSVLSYLENPERTGTWSRRGLVAGQVQSGKTGHYTGLIAKAIDSGYRIVIVLAGMDNNLRSQTQLRIDSGLLGFDTQRRNSSDSDDGFAKDALGAGRVVGADRLPIASLTTSLESGDFLKSSVNVGIRPAFLPIVAVVKKNVSVLKNLREWLQTVCQEDAEGKITQFPILVIDDEADNASINTNKSDKLPTGINREIRRLLNQFQRNCYVGYTATPFANIYIDQDADHDLYGEDLFPRSFIETLKPPSNYFGPSKLFGIDGDEDELPLFREAKGWMDWVPDRHKSDSEIGPIPDSLRLAIKSFVLARAIRLARGQERKHNSMLIHVTRFNDVQRKVREQVEDELELLKARLKFGDGSGIDVRSEFKELWLDDFVPTTESMVDLGYGNEEWETIDSLLTASVDPIVVRSINGDAKDVLDYFDQRESGFNVIAIGGNKLSRGLTLEGLTVSYYLRATKMFDTLLQMGRWFGYRPDYEDVCRLYTTKPIWRAYGQVTAATNEAFKQFDEMCDQGRSPNDYGLRVRNSVEEMLVTSANKMRNGQRVKIGFAGGLSASTSIVASKTESEKNYREFERFIKSLGKELLNSNDRSFRKGPSGNGFVWSGVTGDEVTSFLERIRTPESAYRVNSLLLARYIRGRNAKDLLTKWTVFLSSPGNAEQTIDIAGLNVGLTRRMMPAVKSKKDNSRSVTSTAWEKLLKDGLYTVKTVVSPADELVDFSFRVQEELLEEELEEWRNKEVRGAKPTVPSGIKIRDKRSARDGLLLLYPIQSPLVSYEGLLRENDAKSKLSNLPLLGFAVSFPNDSTAASEEYVVNQQFMREMWGSVSLEDDDEYVD
jgi:hypothetical protein